MECPFGAIMVWVSITMNRRIILFRTPSSSDPFESLLQDHGWTPISLPVLTFRFVNRQQIVARWNNPDTYSGLIVTSPRAAEALIDVAREGNAGWLKKEVYAVGERTGEVLQGISLSPQGQSTGNAVGLGELIIQQHTVGELPLLFLCGNTRRDELPEMLRENDVALEELVVYESSVREDIDLESLTEPAWVVFFNPMGVRAIYERWPMEWQRVRKAAIGETTASAMRSIDWQVNAVAQKPSAEGLCDALPDDSQSSTPG